MQLPVFIKEDYLTIWGVDIKIIAFFMTSFRFDVKVFYFPKVPRALSLVCQKQNCKKTEQIFFFASEAQKMILKSF